MKETSPEIVNLTEINNAISDYNTKIKALNQLWTEQENKGGISAETYEYIKTMFLIYPMLEVQRDELKSTGLYTLTEDKLTKYADEQHEAGQH